MTATKLKEMIQLANGTEEKLVVKVCDTFDIGVHKAALNESHILQ